MPNSIGAAGLTVATQEELEDYFTDMFQTIYGDDISLASDSPDGQIMNIMIQAVLDIQDFLVQINSMFDPDNAVGVILDQRVAINNIQRISGTRSVTNVSIVTSKALNLTGADQDTDPIYTLTDAAGTEWELIDSQSIASAGTHVFAFQAVIPGATPAPANTITTQSSIVLGVDSVNNPGPITSLGIKEESDVNLKVRRQRSVSLGSQGYYNSLKSALENVDGVTSAYVTENSSGVTNADGVPPHSIWVVIAGSPDPAEIAQVIYTKRSQGVGMTGAITQVITQVDGSPFVVSWDTVSLVPIYIKFTATSIDGVNDPLSAQILAGLPLSFVPGVGQEIDITHLGALVQQIDPNTLVTDAGFSTTLGGSYTSTLIPARKNYQFVVTSAKIIISPILLTPKNFTVAALGTLQFTPTGGSGAGYVYSISVNTSGGSINAGTGLYTAGSTLGTDTIHVVDSLGNVGNTGVTVV